jgi:hypothetical protein
MKLSTLLGVKDYEALLDSLKLKKKDSQYRTHDPWIICWEHENTFGSSGVGL